MIVAGTKGGTIATIARRQSFRVPEPSSPKYASALLTSRDIPHAADQRVLTDSRSSRQHRLASALDDRQKQRANDERKGNPEPDRRPP
jgi:hypothetical protein